MEPKIRLYGYEQVRWGDEFCIYPVSEGSRLYEGDVRFVNYGGPLPQGNCRAVSPLSFPAIQFEWLETESFPIKVRVKVDGNYFVGGTYPVPPEMEKDYSTSLSALVRKQYWIPIEFWVGGERTVYTLTFDLDYNREFTPEEERQWKLREDARKLMERGENDRSLAQRIREWWFLISIWLRLR